MCPKSAPEILCLYIQLIKQCTCIPSRTAHICCCYQTSGLLQAVPPRSQRFTDPKMITFTENCDVIGVFCNKIGCLLKLFVTWDKQFVFSFNTVMLTVYCNPFLSPGYQVLCLDIGSQCHFWCFVVSQIK